MPRKIANRATTERALEQIADTARRLQQKAGELHDRAEQIHTDADMAHRRAEKLHADSGQARKQAHADNKKARAKREKVTPRSR